MGLLNIGRLSVIPTKLTNTGEPYYTFSESEVTKSYIDITSNENWMSVGINVYDYIFCRNQVTMRTAVIGFSALTTSEQIVASKHFAVGKSDRDTVLSEVEQQDAWYLLIDRTRKSRQLRWDETKAYISYSLPMVDSIDLGKSTTTLSTEYIVYGVEDFENSGDDGLFDWLGNTAAFSGGTGYSGKSYWSQTDQDKMLEILKNGIY